MISFHALRVHLLVAQWKLLDISCLNPLEWSRKTAGAGLKPVNTDLDTAPENLLSHTQKSATFRFDKSAKNVKNNGPKTGKKTFLVC